MQTRKGFFWLALLIVISGAANGQDTAQPSLCSGWKAWRSHPQSGPPVLHVTAHCELPTPGHKVELVPATPPGSDASVLVLTEIVHSPEGMVAQVITPFDLHFRKKTHTGFKEVLINPEGTRVPIGKAATKTAPTPETR